MRTEAADQHICWTYDDRRELSAYARSYLAAGIAAGERVWFAGPGDPGWLPAGAEFVSLESTYAAGAAVDPNAQVAAYAAATEAALAAGHTGLRVFADCTALVRTGAGLDAFARYEALVDRYIAVAPMRAVCALYRPEAGDRAVGELACLHPATNAGDVRFALRGDPGSPGTALLSGELDGDAERLFPAALGRLQRHAPAADVADVAPGEARRIVRAVGQGCVGPAKLDDLTLAVSEIVANAHRYGRPPVRVRVWAADGRVVVTVDDAGPGPKDPFAGLLAAPSERSAGFGLWITHQVCDHVSLQRTPDGFALRMTVGGQAGWGAGCSRAARSSAASGRA
ncbi:MEDS domain-containing protein [Dactylosporangium sp. McL0621]|uniref:MEDS domain-containing protein n=1 Tax=Dactylosporangium sp. McL0621 TaxID=3415678 RepID=UPI003CF5FFD4